MDKIESVDVDQSLLGRMLGYGTIHVLGTGQGIESLPRRRRPLSCETPSPRDSARSHQAARGAIWAGALPLGASGISGRTRGDPERPGSRPGLIRLAGRMRC